MLSWDKSDCAMATHLSELATDWCLDESNGYTEQDRDAAEKIGKLGHASGLMVTGDSLTVAEGEALLKQVVLSELAHWVPGSSQRLIHRASIVLTGKGLLDPVLAEDHGPLPQDHALVQDWICGVYVMRCCTCAHLFRV